MAGLWLTRKRTPRAPPKVFVLWWTNVRDVHIEVSSGYSHDRKEGEVDVKLKSIATGLAALSLMAAPTLASAATAAAPQPAQEQVDGDNAFLGGEGAIVAVLALLAIAAGIVAAASGNDKPNSP